MSEMIERVARAMMRVMALRPGDEPTAIACPVLSMDPDFDDLPRDHTEGCEDDEITQAAVLALAQAAIEAMREPTVTMKTAAGCGPGQGVFHAIGNPLMAYQAMIDEALK